MRLSLIAICMALVVAACGGQTPVSTSPTTASSTAVAADAGASPTTQRSAPEPVKLRYKYRQGAKYTHRILMKSALVEGKSRREPRGDARITATTTVTSIRRDATTLKVQYTKVKVEGGSSDRAAVNDQPSAKILRGMGFTVKTDSLGTTLDTKFVSKDVESTVVVANEDASFLGPVLPRSPVSPGDTWVSNTHVRLSTSVTALTNRYTFDKWVKRGGRDLALIRSKVWMIRTDKQAGVESKGRASFTYLFDPKAGISIKTDGTSTYTLEGGEKMQTKYAITTAP